MRLLVNIKGRKSFKQLLLLMCSSFHAEMESEGKYFNMSPYDYKKTDERKIKTSCTRHDF